jgi:hypothetical protein
MKKIFAILLLSTVIISNSFNVYAASKNAIVTPTIIPEIIEYSPSSKTFSKTQSWTHTSTNPTNIVQETTYSVARTTSASFTATYEETIDAMIATAGLSLEVAVGTSTTKTEGHTYYVPTHSKYQLIWGSQFVNVGGYEKYYFNGKLQSSKYVTGKWSYESYDDMKYLGSAY